MTIYYLSSHRYTGFRHREIEGDMKTLFTCIFRYILKEKVVGRCLSQQFTCYLKHPCQSTSLNPSPFLVSAFPPNSHPGRQQGMKVFGFPSLSLKTQRVSGFWLWPGAAPGLCGHLGHEPVNRNVLSFSPLSLPLSFKIQTNKYKLKSNTNVLVNILSF